MTNPGEPATLRGHTTRVWRAAFAPDGKTLATGDENGTVKFWNTTLPSDDNVFARNNGEGSVGFSADGRFLAWQDGGLKLITIWDLARSNITHQIKGRNFVFTPTGHRLLVISPEKKLQLWNLEPLAELPSPRDWTEEADGLRKLSRRVEIASQLLMLLATFISGTWRVDQAPDHQRQSWLGSFCARRRVASGFRTDESGCALEHRHAQTCRHV